MRRSWRWTRTVTPCGAAPQGRGWRAWLGSYGPAAFGGDDLPQPGVVIMQYTGHSDYTENDPPTFACVGESDGIANCAPWSGGFKL